MRGAGSAFASGRPTEAEAIWQHLLTLDPGHPEALFHRGNRRRERGEHTAAIADYERALERVPGHAGLLNNLALPLEAIGKAEHPEACYRDILTREPQQADALLNLANLPARIDGWGRGCPSFSLESSGCSIAAAATSATSSIRCRSFPCRCRRWRNCTRRSAGRGQLPGARCRRGRCRIALRANGCGLPSSRPT